MIRFLHPEAFLLGVGVVLLLRRRLLAGPFVTVLRFALLLVVLALLADPWVEGRTSGRDLVLVVDRSRSMPDTTLDTVAELAALAQAQARPGDRIGMVVFGRDVAVEQAPVGNPSYQPPRKVVDPDGTDLAKALDAGLVLIPPNRPGSLLLVSDGEGTGRDVGPAARRALRRAIAIDAVVLRRPGGFDLAVEEVAVPHEAAVGEPVQVSVWVRSDRAVEAPVRVLRDGQEIARGRRRFRRGLSCLRFRDRPSEAGVHLYEVRVALEDDRVDENNRARAVLRVVGRYRVLCVTPGGRADRLTRSLEAAGLDVVVAAPAVAPLTLNALDGFRAVVLEDVPLEDLPVGSDETLSHWVRDLGGGLLMTGGRASFGPGGYHRTSIEDALPVTMEIRQEQRRFFLAMAIALDRSGSMAMAVPGGGTKMDLANLGACAAVDLLGRVDEIAVLAVDSIPHLVVPLTSAAEKEGICRAIRRIESGGGGIFTNTAIRAAARQLQDATHGTKHIVLFADAADAEEPGDYEKLVPALVRAGITVSVIGLGRPVDSDAELLRDVARLGRGRCFFAEDAAELPRLFAQETIQVARSSIVEEPTTVLALPDLITIGALIGATFPSVGGYSIAYLEPGAQQGLVTRDDTTSPLLSFKQYGLGRSAAWLGIADGELSGEMATWDGYADFFSTLVRWVAGTQAIDDVYAEVVRRGHEAVLSVEVDAGREDLLAGLEARVLDPEDDVHALPLVRVDDTRLEARFPLPSEGIYRPVLRLADERILRLPAMTLPYSPEYEPRFDPAEGERTLRCIVRIAEGRLDPPAAELFAGSRTGRGATSLGSTLAWVALGLLLAEIAVRRLGLRSPAVRLAPIGRVLRRVIRRPAFARRARRRVAGIDLDAPTEGAEGGEGRVSRAVVPGPEEPAGPEPDIRSILDRARKRRRR